MLILIGFEDDELHRISERFEDCIPVPEEAKERKLEDIIRAPPEYTGQRLGQQRIVIMHDIPKEKISETMRKIRSIVGKHIIFATSTPTSMQWKLTDLIEELLEEDEYFRNRTK